MRRLLVLLMLMSAVPVYAQQTDSHVAVPHDRAEALGIDIADLESTHLSAIHADPSLSAFPDRSAEFVEAWSSYLSGLADHLKAGGFVWTEPLRGFFRFYFQPDGHSTVVVYRVPALEGERAETFGRLLDSYVRASRIDMLASSPFAQCGPLTLAPPRD